MASRKKVLDIAEGMHLECIKICPKTGEKQPRNPYLLYISYHAPTRCGYGYSKHRTLIAKYGDFVSVLFMVKDMYLYGVDTYPVNAIVEWCKAYCNR